ncbi:MAG: hypothetical protein COA60_003710 [Robiginitomaculum sp.]|nr:hypothetical protein [Robiginitomaculum sp.]
MRIKEEQLFEEWKGCREGFVSDGLVSESDYINSELKLCFVLKEVNDLGGGGWDLREYLKGGARSQTWDNVSRWIYCIRNLKGKGFVKWAELDRIDNEFRTKHLRSICAMNLKKSPGGHTAEKIGFEKVILEDKDYIQKQYNIYGPDVTICCGTGWALRRILDLNENEVFETSRGIKWFLNQYNKPVLMYAHPAARVQDSLLVYGLVDAVNEIYTSQFVDD